ncbi:helix-turn-helix domain-containing protein [Rhizobium ruizarguesonis]
MKVAPEKGQKTQALYALHWMPKLSPAARAVAAWLVWHANASSGRCDPGQSRLCNETGLSRRTIQRAIKELIAEKVIRRQLRGLESSSYEIDWYGLGVAVSYYEQSAKLGKPAIARRRKGGGENDAPPASRTSPQGASKMTPKPVKENTGNKPLFRVGCISENSEDGAHPDDVIADRILATEMDHAFLAYLDREVGYGRRFEPSRCARLNARLEEIYDREDAHCGDPIGGRAYRLLETVLEREGGADSPRPLKPPIQY